MKWCAISPSTETNVSPGGNGYGSDLKVDDVGIARRRLLLRSPDGTDLLRDTFYPFIHHLAQPNWTGVSLNGTQWIAGKDPRY